MPQSTRAASLMLHPVAVRCIPFGLYIGLLAIEAVLGDGSALGIDARWLYAGKVGLVCLALLVFWSRYAELRHLAEVRMVDWALGIAIGVLVFVLWVNLDFGPLTLGRAPGFDPRTDGSIHWGLASTRLAGAALVVPVMEELFWRSFVMRWAHKPEFLDVDPRRVGLKALAISSVLFALEHHLWFAGLLAGLGYGWLYMRTGNLWVPIASHALTNGLLGAWVLYTGSWEFW